MARCSSPLADPQPSLASFPRTPARLPQTTAGLKTVPALHLFAPCSGPLPDPQPGQWPRLRIIDLNNNRFSGTLGQGWAQTGLFRLVRC